MWASLFILYSNISVVRAGGACFKFLAQTEAIHVQHYGRQRRSALKAQVMRNDLLFILLVTQFNWNFFFFSFLKGGGTQAKNPTVQNLNKIETLTLVLHIEPKFTFFFFSM